jgi:transposase
MADNDVLFRQRAVIKFLVKEENRAADIHYRLQRVYGHVCMGASSVGRWVKHFKYGNTSIQDQHHSGRPRTASTEVNKTRVDISLRRTDV